MAMAAAGAALAAVDIGTVMSAVTTGTSGVLDQQALGASICAETLPHFGSQNSRERFYLFHSKNFQIAPIRSVNSAFKPFKCTKNKHPGVVNPAAFDRLAACQCLDLQVSVFLCGAREHSAHFCEFNHFRWAIPSH